MKTIQAIIRAAGFVMFAATGNALVVHFDKPSNTTTLSTKK